MLQKADYDVLVKELTCHFTPVQIQSEQTSLFHDQKQGDHKSVVSYAQDLDPGGDIEQRGLLIEKALLQPDGEHCVCLPIQNLSYGAVELESGVTLGRVQPVTIIEEITGQMGEAFAVSSLHKPASSNLRDAKLLKSVHLEESLSPKQVE